MNDAAAGSPVSDADYLAVQRFLHREAALLDRRAFEAWLALLTDDVEYKVTVQLARDAAMGNLEYAIIDEGVDDLRSRIAQIGNPGLTRAENPASLTRRFISSLEAHHGSAPSELVAHSSLLVYRSRALVPEGGFYVGERRDVLRRVEGGLRLARRHVRLDHEIVFGGAVSTLF
jgi:3-phenylpropionate/cinnamic acid dioxygenase small subunit